MADDDQMSEIAATQIDEPPLEDEHKEPDGDAHLAESQETEMGLEDADGEPDPEHMPEGETGSQDIPGLTGTEDDHAENQLESHSQSEVIPGLNPTNMDEDQSKGEHAPASPASPPAHPLAAEPTLVLSENEPEIKVEDFAFSSSQNVEESAQSPLGESAAGEKSDQPVDESVQEPPDSTSTSNTSVQNAESANPPAATRQPSANRLSISYANGLRRLVIDADIVEKMRVFRAESRIEVAMTVERVSDGFKGILVRIAFQCTCAVAYLHA